MRLLMLGWEYPPRATGGLGPACREIARGLAARGTRVTFVLPRDAGFSAADGEEAVELVGADRVPLRRRRARYVPWSEPRASDECFEILAVASTLRPYDRPAAYARRVLSPGASAGGIDPGASAGASAARRGRAPVVRLAMEETCELEPPRPFEGGYGASLVEEVERYARAVSELVRGRDFDLVHAHDWMTWPAGLRVAERAGLPLVLHVHSTELDRCGDRPDPRIRAIEELALARADRVVCVSRFTADLVERCYGVQPERVAVVHNGLPARRERDGEPRPDALESGAPLVLWVGRLTRQKGPAHFLEAAALVAAAEPRTRFAMCGDGELLEDLVGRARELGLGRRVRFTGFLPPEAVRRLQRSASVLVAPSLAEPFGLVALEAADAGVPVVLSRRSGALEVLPSALRADPWDARALADGVLAVLRRPALRAELVQGARADLDALRERDPAAALHELHRSLRHSPESAR